MSVLLEEVITMADDKKSPKEHTEKDPENATESDEKVNDAEVKGAKKKVAGKAKEKKEEEGDDESSEDEELFGLYDKPSVMEGKRQRKRTDFLVKDQAEIKKEPQPLVFNRKGETLGSMEVGEELKFYAALKKYGLQPSEFKDLLTSKMEKLFNGIKTNLLSPVTTSKEKATQCLCIRANTTNSKVLDQRKRVANRLRILEGFKGKLSDPMKSPSCIQEEPRGEGDINPSKSVHNEYHLEQAELFWELQKQGKLDSNSFNDNGYLLENNGKKCSIVSMCNKLDSITQEYIKEYEKEQKNPTKRRGQDGEAAKRNWESLVKLFLPCIRIIMGRTSVDWAIANDIMSVNGYKQWKEHVWALMTFAALSVVIDALSKLPEYGSNSLFEFIDQPPDQKAN